MSKLGREKIVRKGDGLFQNVLGDEETVKLTGKDTQGQFLMIEQNCSPGVGIPLHVHKNEDEVFKVLKGTMKVVIGSTVTILEEGDMAFCPRGVPHSWEIVGDQKAKTILMNFPAGLEEMLAKLADLDANASFKEIESISNDYGIQFLESQLS